MASAPCVLDRYAAHLPIGPRTPWLTLGESGTPLVRHEGVFVEPASAAAGLRKRAREGGLRGASRVVCVLTGNGLKDPDTARSLSGETAEVEATAEAVMRATRRTARV